MRRLFGLFTFVSFTFSLSLLVTLTQALYYLLVNYNLYCDCREVYYEQTGCIRKVGLSI